MEKSPQGTLASSLCTPRSLASAATIQGLESLGGGGGEGLM